MTYREKLEKLHNGELTDEEKKTLEEDIEKHEAISDYLYEQESVPNLDELLKNNGEEKEEINSSKENFTKLINKSIRHAFVKLGAGVAIFTILVVLFVQFALSNLVSVFYYNPLKENGTNGNQMSLDMAVYSELYLPCMKRDSVTASSRGYGKYDITINQTTSYSRKFVNVSGEVNRGKLKLFESNILREPPSNVFAWSQIYGDKEQTLKEMFALDNNENYNICAAGKPEDAINFIQELKEDELYIGYVSLNQITPYEDFINFSEGIESYGDVWCGVQTEPWSAGYLSNVLNVGFSYRLGAFSVLPGALMYDEKVYPELLPWTLSEEGTDRVPYDELDNNMKQEEYMTTHFSSLLRYMADQKAFCKMMGKDSQALRQMADYVSKNGLEVYGFAAILDKENLLELSKQPEVYEIYVQEAQ